jgi:molybdopterin converting factor small subunit
MMSVHFVTVRVLAFARIRELLGFGEQRIGVADGTTAGAVWAQFEHDVPLLAGLRTSTRFARNGALVDETAVLREGDELALLPPVGGG